MKSAYEILGVSADAPLDEIETAYRRAQDSYPSQGQALSDSAFEHVNDVRMAWQVLRDPQTRAAHNRKLAGARHAAAIGSPPSAETTDQPSAALKIMRVGAVLTAVLLAAGGYLSWRNAERRDAAAAAEQAATELRVKEEKERAAAAAMAEEQRRIETARAEAAEHRLTEEARSQLQWRTMQGNVAAANAQAAKVAEERRQQADERRKEYEVRRRIEFDKQRVRQLCFQNYHTPNC